MRSGSADAVPSEVLRLEPKQPEALEALARLRPLKAPAEAEPAVRPSPATHAILRYLTAGEGVCQAGGLLKALYVEYTTSYLKHT